MVKQKDIRGRSKGINSKNEIFNSYYHHVELLEAIIRLQKSELEMERQFKWSYFFLGMSLGILIGAVVASL